MRRNPYDIIGRLGVLVAVLGAINWLLIGLFEWNFVQWVFTSSAAQNVPSVGERIVYVVIGVGGIIAIPMLAATLSRSRTNARYTFEYHEEAADRTRRAQERVAESKEGVAAASAEQRAREAARFQRTPAAAEQPAAEASFARQPAASAPGTAGRPLSLAERRGWVGSNEQVVASREELAAAASRLPNGSDEDIGWDTRLAA